MFFALLLRFKRLTTPVSLWMLFFFTSCCFTSCTPHKVSSDVSVEKSESRTIKAVPPSSKGKVTSSTTTALTKKGPIPQKNKKEVAPVIVIDAGHGGHDLGTNSKRYRYQEKRTTLTLAKLVQKELTRKGYQVILTRDQDAFIPLAQRVEIANKAVADLFVSIHCNSSSNLKAQGIEIFYYPLPKDGARTKSSLLFAQRTLKSLLATTQASSRGVKDGNFAVIRGTKMPAILVEVGFFTHTEERKKLKTTLYLQQVAKGIASGVSEQLAASKKI